MTGGENSRRFYMGIALRVIGLLGLIALPTITGQMLNLVTGGGSVEELTRWFVYALIAAAIYLVLSFFAERIFADLATKGRDRASATGVPGRDSGPPFDTFLPLVRTPLCCSPIAVA